MVRQRVTYRLVVEGEPGADVLRRNYRWCLAQRRAGERKSEQARPARTEPYDADWNDRMERMR